MIWVVVFVAVVEFIVGGGIVISFLFENERFPGSYRRWTPYTLADGPGITVGIRRRSEHTRLCTIPLSYDNFDERLYEAQSLARQRCIELNSGERHIRRRLPR